MNPVRNLVPMLETERLILRGIRFGDFAPFAAFMATEGSAFIGGPIDDVAAWRKLSAYAGDWQLRGFSKFAVEDKTTGKFAGLVGPWFPVGWPEPEIAWTLMPEFQGRGYAREAAQRALRFVYEDLGWATAVSCMNPANAPSIRLAESLGATFEGMTEIRPYGEARLYRHRPASDFVPGDTVRGAA